MSLSPLLFAIATHPLFCALEALSENGSLMDLQIGDKRMDGLGFADDTLMFLKASNVNLSMLNPASSVYGDG